MDDAILGAGVHVCVTAMGVRAVFDDLVRMVVLPVNGDEKRHAVMLHRRTISESSNSAKKLLLACFTPTISLREKSQVQPWI